MANAPNWVVTYDGIIQWGSLGEGGTSGHAGPGPGTGRRQGWHVIDTALDTVFVWRNSGAAPAVAEEEAEEVVKTGGKGDGKRRILSVKPTGLLDRPVKAKTVSRVDERVEDSRQIQAEVAGELARQLREDIDREVPPVVMMDLAAVEAEIGRILRKKVRTDEDEVLLLLLMVAVST